MIKQKGENDKPEHTFVELSNSLKSHNYYRTNKMKIKLKSQRRKREINKFKKGVVYEINNKWKSVKKYFLKHLLQIRTKGKKSNGTIKKRPMVD